MVLVLPARAKGGWPGAPAHTMPPLRTSYPYWLSGWRYRTGEGGTSRQQLSAARTRGRALRRQQPGPRRGRRSLRHARRSARRPAPCQHADPAPPKLPQAHHGQRLPAGAAISGVDAHRAVVAAARQRPVVRAHGPHGLPAVWGAQRAQRRRARGRHRRRQLRPGQAAVSGLGQAASGRRGWAASGAASASAGPSLRCGCCSALGPRHAPSFRRSLAARPACTSPRLRLPPPSRSLAIVEGGPNGGAAGGQQRIAVFRE